MTLITPLKPRQQDQQTPRREDPSKLLTLPVEIWLTVVPYFEEDSMNSLRNSTFFHARMSRELFIDFTCSLIAPPPNRIGANPETDPIFGQTNVATAIDLEIIDDLSREEDIQNPIDKYLRSSLGVHLWVPFLQELEATNTLAASNQEDLQKKVVEASETSREPWVLMTLFRHKNLAAFLSNETILIVMKNLAEKPWLDSVMSLLINEINTNDRIGPWDVTLVNSIALNMRNSSIHTLIHLITTPNLSQHLTQETINTIALNMNHDTGWISALGHLITTPNLSQHLTQETINTIALNMSHDTQWKWALDALIRTNTVSQHLTQETINTLVAKMSADKEWHWSLQQLTATPSLSQHLTQETINTLVAKMSADKAWHWGLQQLTATPSLSQHLSDANLTCIVTTMFENYSFTEVMHVLSHHPSHIFDLNRHQHIMILNQLKENLWENALVIEERSRLAGLHRKITDEFFTYKGETSHQSLQTDPDDVFLALPSDIISLASKIAAGIRIQMSLLRGPWVR